MTNSATLLLTFSMAQMHRRRFLQHAAALAGGGMGLVMSGPTHAALDQGAFQARQAQRRQELWSLLGDLPERRTPKARLRKAEKHDGYTLEHLELDLNGVEPVPAYLLLPEKRQKPAPGLLYIHAHGGNYQLGKDELFQG